MKNQQVFSTAKKALTFKLLKTSSSISIPIPPLPYTAKIEKCETLPASQVKLLTEIAKVFSDKTTGK